MITKTAITRKGVIVIHIISFLSASIELLNGTIGKWIISYTPQSYEIRCNIITNYKLIVGYILN